jgi:hypothetical protein
MCAMQNISLAVHTGKNTLFEEHSNGCTKQYDIEPRLHPMLYSKELSFHSADSNYQILNHCQMFYSTNLAKIPYARQIK